MERSEPGLEKKQIIKGVQSTDALAQGQKAAGERKIVERLLDIKFQGTKDWYLLIPMVGSDCQSNTIEGKNQRRQPRQRRQAHWKT